MKRPSFQFYPGDWLSNGNLRRCTDAEQGVWVRVLCVLHDQDEYGLVRWTLKELAQAANTTVKMLKSLAQKSVLKGADAGEKVAPFVYVPRSGRKDGEPVTLIAAQDGPLWYSSRLVRDEHVRIARGSGSRFDEGRDDAPKEPTKAAPKPSLIPGIGEGNGDDIGPCARGRSSSSSSSTSLKDKVKTIVEQGLDERGGDETGNASTAEPEHAQAEFTMTPEEPASVAEASKPKTEAEIIEGVFGYWRRCMNSPKSKLDEKRRGMIRRALKAGYSPRDLCRAIQGCALTPHNQGVNDRGQKYLGIHVCLKDADQIDRFMANAKAPPVAPEKKASGQIPGWWKDDGLAQQQAGLVGVVGPHPHESRDAFHARIRAAIENGGKPPEPIAVPTAATPESQEERVQLTDEQRAANRAALHAALKGGKPSPGGVTSVAPVVAGGSLAAHASIRPV